MTKFPYLPEQLAIIESSDRSFKVKAGAGTGKTSTLVGYAEKNPDKRMLYLAFNKAIQEEAAGRFPKNVVCRTTHSVAYGAEGFRYKDKLDFNLRVMGVAKLFRVPVGVAYGGISALQEWLHSADKNLAVRHAQAAEVPNDKQDAALMTASRLWERMVDPHNTEVPMIHDGYLKLFQISGKQMTGFDVVLMDEAQDANPVTSAIVSAFAGRKVLVGDSNQSIYAFRGAKDAMNDFKAKEYLLRTSFRFGQKVGDCANTIIEYAIGDTMRIVGGGKPSTILSPSDTFRRTGVSAVIARTNAFLIDRAMQNIDDQRSFYVVGGVASLKLDLLMDAYRLFTGRENMISEIRTPFLKQFDGWEHFEFTANESGDPELLSLARTVNKYKGRLPNVIVAVRQNCQASSKDADETLVTGHKSKGLEFDHVTLGNDFAELCKADEEEGIDVQEANLIYVAITRAKKDLVLNEDLHRFMQAPVRNKAVFDGAKIRARA